MSGETPWTDALDAFLEDTGKRIAVFMGSGSIAVIPEMEAVREQLAGEIVHNMFQFVERHGAQGGKHAEVEPRSGAEGGYAESSRDAAESSDPR